MCVILSGNINYWKGNHVELYTMCTAVKWKCEMLSESLWGEVRIPEVAAACDAITGRATTGEQNNGDNT